MDSALIDEFPDEISANVRLRDLVSDIRVLVFQPIFEIYLA